MGDWRHRIRKKQVSEAMQVVEAPYYEHATEGFSLL